MHSLEKKHVLQFVKKNSSQRKEVNKDKDFGNQGGGGGRWVLGLFSFLENNFENYKI